MKNTAIHRKNRAIYHSPSFSFPNSPLTRHQGRSTRKVDEINPKTLIFHPFDLYSSGGEDGEVGATQTNDGNQLASMNIV